MRERRIAIKAHLKPLFPCYAGDIGPIEVEAYKRKRPKVSPATINNELKVLSCILKFGIEFGYLADMPKIKRLKVPVKNPHFLSEDQVWAVLSAAVPAICPKSAQKPKKTKKGKPAKTGIPFGIQMVPKAGFEPARVSPPPPQDGVSASSTTSARCRKIILIHAPAENQDEDKVSLFKSPPSLYSFPENPLPCGGWP